MHRNKNWENFGSYRILVEDWGQSHKQCLLPFDFLGINKATTTLTAQNEQGRSRWHHSPLISDQVPSGKFLQCLPMQMEDCNQNLWVHWEKNPVHNLRNTMLGNLIMMKKLIFIIALQVGRWIQMHRHVLSLFAHWKLLSRLSADQRSDLSAVSIVRLLYL